MLISIIIPEGMKDKLDTFKKKYPQFNIVLGEKNDNYEFEEFYKKLSRAVNFQKKSYVVRVSYNDECCIKD